MARCQLVIGLVLLHLCLALSYEGGFEFAPGLIPQAQDYYPPQNPYARYNLYDPRSYNRYPQQQPYYGSENYEQDQPDPALIDLQDMQTPSTGETAPTTTGPSTPSDTAVVQTPDQTQESTGTSEPNPTTNSNMDALDIQLAAALEAVKADMISKGKQVLEEKQWTDDVKAVIEQYTKKIHNVYGNIEKLKKDMGDLYKKKNQIINAQIQKELAAKLKDSNDDLRTVQAALDKVTNTQMQFQQSKKDIQQTIDDIFAQLAELKGTPAPASGATGETGEAAGSEAGGDAAAKTPEGETPAANSEAAGTNSESEASDSSDDDTDIVDRTAEINSKIDTIKSIVSALNK